VLIPHILAIEEIEETLNLLSTFNHSGLTSFLVLLFLLGHFLGQIFSVAPFNFGADRVAGYFVRFHKDLLFQDIIFKVIIGTELEIISAVGSIFFIGNFDQVFHHRFILFLDGLIEHVTVLEHLQPVLADRLGLNFIHQSVGLILFVFFEHFGQKVHFAFGGHFMACNDVQLAIKKGLLELVEFFFDDFYFFVLLFVKG